MVWTDNNIVFFQSYHGARNNQQLKEPPSSGPQEYQRNLEFEQRANQLSTDDQPSNLKHIGYQLRK